MRFIIRMMSLNGRHELLREEYNDQRQLLWVDSMGQYLIFYDLEKAYQETMINISQILFSITAISTGKFINNKLMDQYVEYRDHNLIDLNRYFKEKE